MHLIIQYSFRYYSNNRKQRYWTIDFQVLVLFAFMRAGTPLPFFIQFEIFQFSDMI